MTDSQTNKYLYLAEADTYATNEDIADLNERMDELIEGKWNDALNRSGYIADCVLRAQRPFSIRIEKVSVKDSMGEVVSTYHKLIVGEEGKTASFYVPNGPNNYSIVQYTGELLYNNSEANSQISSSKVVDGNFVLVMDCTNATPEILLIPMRIADDNGNYWQYFFARRNEPVPVESKPVWWDINNNVIRQYDETNHWNNNTIKRYSIPLCIIHQEDGVIKNIVQEFGISGYSDQAIWVNPNVKVGIANGRNDDSAVNILEATTGILVNDVPTYPEVITVDTTEYPISQVNEYNPSDSISSLILQEVCYDARTLTISANVPASEDENAIISPDNWVLDADMSTVKFFPALTDVSKLYITYYDQPSNIPIFVSATGELINPTLTKDYSYNSTLGYYTDINGVKDACFRLGVFSMGYVANKSLWTQEELSIIDYYSKQRSLLTDTDDVRYMIETYNADLLRIINEILRRLGNTQQDIDRVKDDILAELNALKAIAVKTTTNQTIRGIKTFVDTAVFNGNINMNGQNAKLMVAGHQEIGGDQTVGGKATFNGDVDVNGTQTITGAQDINGNQTISGTQKVSGIATFEQIIMGTAYRALSADIAEYYSGDEVLPEGTLVQFGGTNEITKAAKTVNGVVSSNPAYILNGAKDMENPTLLALSGRVPVRVVGPIHKFDLIKLSHINGVAIADNLCYNPIGRALEDNMDEDEKLVECVVQLQI